MASDQHHWLVTVALVTSSFIALVANLLLLLVFCRRRGLRTISNRFTINLLLTNLLSSTLLIPFLIVDQELTASLSGPSLRVNSTENIIFQEDTLDGKGELIISDYIITTDESDNTQSDDDYSKVNGTLCYFGQSIVGLICAASILSILLIGIDQYFAVIHSLRYHAYIDKFNSFILIISSWIVAIIFGILGALNKNEPCIWSFCAKREESLDKATTPLSSAYALVYFIFIIMVPFLAICVIYVCIYAAAHHNSVRMRKAKGNNHSNFDSSTTPMKSDSKTPSESRLNLQKDAELCSGEKLNSQATLPKVHSAPNFLNLVQEQSTNEHIAITKVARTQSDRVGFITNLKCKISNASAFRYREETRAAKISILVIFMVLVCYIPYGLAVLLNSDAVGVPTNPAINFTTLVLLIVSNIISPFLFAYRNRRIRRELLKFLGCAMPKNSLSIVRKSIVRPKLVSKIIEEENERADTVQPFLLGDDALPQVVVTSNLDGKQQTERNSILKRVCSVKNWPSYKKCSFITVPENCWQTESARGSFSSASTQISADE